MRFSFWTEMWSTLTNDYEIIHLFEVKQARKMAIRFNTFFVRKLNAAPDGCINASWPLFHPSPFLVKNSLNTMDKMANYFVCQIIFSLSKPKSRTWSCISLTSLVLIALDIFPQCMYWPFFANLAHLLSLQFCVLFSNSCSLLAHNSHKLLKDH